MHTVDLIAHSECNGKRIATVALRYWRAIHPEMMTHRAFSRNASSSRAIPVSKVISQVWHDPAMPEHWGKNKKGMQADAEVEGWKYHACRITWSTMGKVACIAAWVMMKCGLHKQVANRILEPWQYISVIITSTEWDNFFSLRCHDDAQPEIRSLATTIRSMLESDVPDKLKEGEWHTPYADEGELNDRLVTSTARCCRVSYNNHEGKVSTSKDDVSLHNRLLSSKPEHASPSEHQAMAMGDDNWYYNLSGWMSYRYARDKLPRAQVEKM